MELILKETIDTLGEEGAVVKVKPGYARNYLIPHRMAVLASPANLATLEQQKTIIGERKEKQRREAENLAKKISSSVIMIEHRVGEEDKLFGSVTAADISEKLDELGIAIDRKKILLDEPIKTLGMKTVIVKIGYQLTAELKVEVVPLAGE